MQSWLFWNSLCRRDRPRTNRDPPASAGITANLRRMLKKERSLWPSWRLKQWSQRNWDFPRNFTLAETWCQPDGELISQTGSSSNNLAEGPRVETMMDQTNQGLLSVCLALYNSDLLLQPRWGRPTWGGLGGGSLSFWMWLTLTFSAFQCQWFNWLTENEGMGESAHAPRRHAYFVLSNFGLSNSWLNLQTWEQQW